MVISHKKHNPFKRTSIPVAPADISAEADYLARKSIDYELRQSQIRAQLEQKAKADEQKAKSDELKQKRKEAAAAKTLVDSQVSVIPDSQEPAGDENAAKNQVCLEQKQIPYSSHVFCYIDSTRHKFLLVVHQEQSRHSKGAPRCNSIRGYENWNAAV